MPVYSHSRLSVYETCPRQYKFQYVDRLPAAEVETVEMFLGERVHETLEALYLNVRFGRIPTLENLLSFYHGRWQEAWHDEVRILRPEVTAADYRRLGERQLGTYYRRYDPFDGDHTLAVERRLVFPLDTERTVWFQGYVDRLSRTPDGGWQIRDYKTGQYLPIQGTLDEDRQLGLYQLGVQHLWPTAGEVELVWHYLAHDLEFRSQRSSEELEALRIDTLDLVRRIERDEAFPTEVGPHCQTCSYQPVCPAWRHLGEVQAMAPEVQSQEAIVQWVDRLGELTVQRKAVLDELHAEIESLEQRITEYAAARVLEAVFGRAYRAALIRRKRVRYPLKDDVRRAELEALLRRHGQWEELATLDIRRLAARMRSGEWPSELTAAVSRYLEREQILTVKVSRLEATTDH